MIKNVFFLGLTISFLCISGCSSFHHKVSGASSDPSQNATIWNGGSFNTFGVKFDKVNGERVNNESIIDIPKGENTIELSCVRYEANKFEGKTKYPRHFANVRMKLIVEPDVDYFFKVLNHNHEAVGIVEKKECDSSTGTCRIKKIPKSFQGLACDVVAYKYNSNGFGKQYVASTRYSAEYRYQRYDLISDEAQSCRYRENFLKRKIKPL